MPEDIKWKTAGQLNIKDAQDRMRSKGWRMTGVEVTLAQHPNVRTIIPIILLLPERAHELETCLEAIEKDSGLFMEELISRIGGKPNGGTVH